MGVPPLGRFVLIFFDGFWWLIIIRGKTPVHV